MNSAPELRIGLLGLGLFVAGCTATGHIKPSCDSIESLERLPEFHNISSHAQACIDEENFRVAGEYLFLYETYARYDVERTFAHESKDRMWDHFHVAGIPSALRIEAARLRLSTDLVFLNQVCPRLFGHGPPNHDPNYLQSSTQDVEQGVGSQKSSDEVWLETNQTQGCKWVDMGATD